MRVRHCVDTARRARRGSVVTQKTPLPRTMLTTIRHNSQQHTRTLRHIVALCGRCKGTARLMTPSSLMAHDYVPHRGTITALLATYRAVSSESCTAPFYQTTRRRGQPGMRRGLGGSGTRARAVPPRRAEHSGARVRAAQHAVLASYRASYRASRIPPEPPSEPPIARALLRAPPPPCTSLRSFPRFPSLYPHAFPVSAP